MTDWLAELAGFVSSAGAPLSCRCGSRKYRLRGSGGPADAFTAEVDVNGAAHECGRRPGFTAEEARARLRELVSELGGEAECRSCANPIVFVRSAAGPILCLSPDGVKHVRYCRRSRG